MTQFCGIDDRHHGGVGADRELDGDDVVDGQSAVALVQKELDSESR